MPADEDERVGRSATHAADEGERVVDLERVHAGDADHARARGPEIVLDGTRETQIAQRDVVAAGFERGADVLHPERFDSEERTEAEAFVAGHGPQQQHVHGRSVRVS